MTVKPKMEGYIHIPFCAKKCSYCDFLSFSMGRGSQRSYVDALIGEIRAASREYDGYTMSSVFLGGGTPTLLSPGKIQQIMKAMYDAYDISLDAEITIECNPCTVNESKLEEYLNAGINRLSIGCQSLNDSHLKTLGRLHDSKDFLRSLQLAKKAGFKNISVDLIFGLPNQRVEQWINDLRIIAGLDVQHISAYSLIIEEGTGFYDIKESLDLPCEDELLKMYEASLKVLNDYGFYQYEVSNFARSGFESVHNCGYWTGVPYRGFGLGASSYERINTSKGTGEHFIRYRNTSDFAEYLDHSADPGLIRCDLQELEKEDLYSEFMILGLRMRKGISPKTFYDRFGTDIFNIFGPQLNKHIKQGTLVFEKGQIFVPEKYFFVSNQILTDFI